MAVQLKNTHMRCVMVVNWWFVLHWHSSPVQLSFGQQISLWVQTEPPELSVPWTLPRVKKPSRWLLFITEDPHHGHAGGDGSFSSCGAKPGVVSQKGSWCGCTVCGEETPLEWRWHCAASAPGLWSEEPFLFLPMQRAPCPVALPAQVPCPRPPCLSSPQEPPQPTGLKDTFHCCKIPGQLQIKWTGRMVAQLLTT